MNYYEKYLKYKFKYLNLKKILGGMPTKQERHKEDLNMLKTMGYRYLSSKKNVSDVVFVKNVEKIDDITFTKHGRERTEQRLNENQFVMDMQNPEIKKVMFTAMYNGNKTVYIILNARIYILRSDRSRSKFILITTYQITPTLKQRKKNTRIKKEKIKAEVRNVPSGKKSKKSKKSKKGKK